MRKSFANRWLGSLCKITAFSPASPRATPRQADSGQRSVWSGWAVGKDAWPSIQLSKSAVAAGKAGATRGTKDVPLYKRATCAFDAKKIHRRARKGRREKS